MKRFLILGVFTVACAAVVHDDASAWVNSNFGVGLNWSYQCGGNDFLGGLIHCGQPCGPDYVNMQVPVGGNRPCCCQGQPVTIPGQVYCTPGNGGGMAPAAPAAPCPPGANGAPGAPVQAFRYAYRPVYSPYMYGYGR